MLQFDGASGIKWTVCIEWHALLATVNATYANEATGVSRRAGDSAIYIPNVWNNGCHIESAQISIVWMNEWMNMAECNGACL